MNSDYNASRPADHDQNIGSRSEESTTITRQDEEHKTPQQRLSPEIPNADLSVDFSSIMGSTIVEDEKIEKRKSNLLKLNEENEKLQRELKAMSDRLEAAERKRAQLQAKEQKVGQ
ncbi:hypothetical protein P691DRAFT_801537 [Macrolepiota fuliginosa MF-IS2]|uniref:Uncharacterized protein n=1 Tax=Macrolepiota fuliginosa MF-IS2 TaxID=1400762 RepID=A0A9P5XKN9_9AGAR|nr:hypothetical protein P691DRAFT_801537 [Macrolepiota fuliginosa MF-IS2]